MAVFLDRDGTISRNPPFGDYIKSVMEFELLPGSAEAIKSMNDAEIPVYVITNQSCIHKGIVPEETVEQINDLMEHQLAEQGARIDKIYVCPHAPGEGCGCRKPAIGFFRQAAEEFDIDLSDSFMVGDADKDIEAGKAAGCRTILVEGDVQKEPTVHADYQCENLKKAVDIILSQAP